ncbi:hypothetical protein J6590_002683 [Homalodisca vitripennis]|nr:hypothetical protein J6590_002683 [Homalodisca vitripennis]
MEWNGLGQKISYQSFLRSDLFFPPQNIWTDRDSPVATQYLIKDRSGCLLTSAEVTHQQKEFIQPIASSYSRFSQNFGNSQGLHDVIIGKTILSENSYLCIHPRKDRLLCNVCIGLGGSFVSQRGCEVATCACTESTVAPNKLSSCQQLLSGLELVELDSRLPQVVTSNQQCQQFLSGLELVELDSRLPQVVTSNQQCQQLLSDLELVELDSRLPQVVTSNQQKHCSETTPYSQCQQLLSGLELVELDSRLPQVVTSNHQVVQLSRNTALKQRPTPMPATFEWPGTFRARQPSVPSCHVKSTSCPALWKHCSETTLYSQCQQLLSGLELVELDSRLPQVVTSNQQVVQLSRNTALKQRPTLSASNFLVVWNLSSSTAVCPKLSPLQKHCSETTLYSQCQQLLSGLELVELDSRLPQVVTSNHQVVQLSRNTALKQRPTPSASNF